MPITIRWDTEDKTTIYQQYYGTWTWDEFWASVEKISALMGEVDHQVDVLINLSTFEVPIDFMAQIRVMDDALMQLRPRMRYAIAFDIPSLMQAILRVARTLYPRVARYVILVKTIEDAYDFIEKNPHPSDIAGHT